MLLPALQEAYAEIDKLLEADSGLKGALFWQWFNNGQEAPASEGGGRGLFGELRLLQDAGCCCLRLACAPPCSIPTHHPPSRTPPCSGPPLTTLPAPRHPACPPPPAAGIYDTDEAFQPILDSAQTVQRLNAQPLAGCVPASHRAAPVDPVPDCQQTWVNGAPGTGGWRGRVGGGGGPVQL